jgi:lysyl-tRNA synthetase class II
MPDNPKQSDRRMSQWMASCTVVPRSVVFLRPPQIFPSLCSVEDLTPALAGKTVLVRARFQGVRDTGKMAFVTLRQGIATVQAVFMKATNADMFKFLTGGITKESFVDVTAKVTTPEKPVVSVSQGNVELSLETVFVISKASPVLPFQLEDAARSDAQIAARDAEIKAAEAEGKPAPAAFPLVNPVSDARGRLSVGCGRSGWLSSLCFLSTSCFAFL